MTPEHLRYTAQHEWVQALDAGDRVRVGITDFAQGALGDIVYIQLPEEGTEVEAGEPIGEIESTKSVSDVYAPVSGVVSARNGALDSSPDLVNSDPYGQGWMLELSTRAPVDDGALMDAATYRQQTELG